MNLMAVSWFENVANHIGFSGRNEPGKVHVCF